jgi:hypothetical protein
MKDYFHDARIALNVAQVEYWTVNSLSAVGAYSTNHACETAVRGIWEKATGEIFPDDYFKPYHKPVVYIKRMGLWPYYSSQTQAFMEKQHGMALDEVRYENTQAYRDHTNPKSGMRGKELIAGTLAVLEETEKLSHNGAVLECIRPYASKVRKNVWRLRQLRRILSRVRGLVTTLLASVPWPRRG